MKDYMLIFRLNILDKEAQPTKAQLETYMQQWMQWIGTISEKGQLIEGGNHLQYSGRVIRPGNKISDLPYSANSESVAGYILIRARDLEDATAIAGACPILNGSDTNSVEIRETAEA